jgi:integrase
LAPEWAAIERRDVDRTRRLVFVRGTKTHKSRREAPLTTTALAALDGVPPRIDSRYVTTMLIAITSVVGTRVWHMSGMTLAADVLQTGEIQSG